MHLGTSQDTDIKHGVRITVTGTGIGDIGLGDKGPAGRGSAFGPLVHTDRVSERQCTRS
jgi:hypothetical protein